MTNNNKNDDTITITLTGGLAKAVASISQGERYPSPQTYVEDLLITSANHMGYDSVVGHTQIDRTLRAIESFRSHMFASRNFQSYFEHDERKRKFQQMIMKSA